MSARPRRTELFGAPADGLEGYRRLAARVIGQALRDAAGHAGGTGERESARRFLSGSQMLEHWCQLAEIDAAGLGRRVRLNGLPAVARGGGRPGRRA